MNAYQHILEPRPRNWGTIAKCPHCEATNIKRQAPKQITCGKPSCREAQRKAVRRD